MKIVIVILTILSTTLSEHPELKLITELNNFFDFDHNFFLLESSTIIHRFISSRSEGELPPKTLFVLKNFNGNIAGLPTGIEISSKNTFVIVVLSGSSFDEESNLFRGLKTIQRLQINMKIGFFLPYFNSMNELKELFQWCKESLFTYAFAASHVNPDADGREKSKLALNIFTFNHFGPFHVINLTINDPYENLFPSLQSNFQQHQLRVSYPFDDFIDGSIAKNFWSLVLHLMNGSFSEEEEMNNYTNVDELLINGIDVIVGLVHQTIDVPVHVYPMFIRSWEIIVPEALPYSDFSAYLHIVTTDKFFGFSMFTIAAVILFLALCRYVKHSKFIFIGSAADVLNLLMNDNGRIRYQKLSGAEVSLIGPLTFVGFVITNGFLSNLQSYLTRPVLQPQIKTLEEIHNCPFPILALGEYWKMELTEALQDRTIYQDWDDKIITIEQQQYEEIVSVFNTSISVFAEDITADIALRIQKRSHVRGYYNSNLRISSSLLSFGVHEKFLFFDRFNEIINRMKNAGLIDLWQRRDIDHVVEGNIKLLHHFITGNDRNDAQNIEFPVFIVYGWIAGTILLVFEIIWKNFKSLYPLKFPYIRESVWSFYR